MMLGFTAIFVYLLAYDYSGKPTYTDEITLLGNEPELKYVFELNRHGARSPVDIYKDNKTYGFSLAM